MSAERSRARRTAAAAVAAAVLAAWLLAPGPAHARQGATPAPAPAAAPRTGDAWIDLRLSDMDAYAARYPDAFIDELVRYFDAPRPLVAERLAARTAPGDVYYACAVARVTGRPCRSVLEARDAAADDGWAAVASRLGIALGKPEAQRLRQAFEASYRHWARPQPSPGGRAVRAQPEG